MMETNVRSINLEQAFNTLKTLDDGSKEYNEIEEKAIKGIYLKFSLFDVLTRRTNIVEKGKVGKVIINNKIYAIKDYDEELMEREKLIKRFLIDKLEAKQIAKPRGMI